MHAFDENVCFIPFVLLSFKSFADSDEVASIALNTSVHVPKYRIVRWLKWWLLRCQYNWSRSYFERHTDTAAMCWNGLNSSRRAFIEGAQRAGAATVLFELAPLPQRITIDSKGVNYLNSLPINLEFYQNWQAQNSDTTDAWQQVRKQIVSRQETKNKNVQQNVVNMAEIPKPYLFVPLQVQGDSQIRLFGGLIQSVTQFVKTLDDYADQLPDNWTLRIKEHPTSEEPYHLDKIINKPHKITVDNSTDTMELIKHSAGVITVNSSVGLEALFFKKPVLLFGQAFYGIEKIVHQLESLESIADIFSNPELYFNYNPDAVVPFLNYLCCVYYPQVEMHNRIVHKIDSQWLYNFKTQLHTHQKAKI